MNPADEVLQEIRKEMKEMHKEQTDVLETVQFIKNNAVTKTEFEQFRAEVATKDHVDRKIDSLKGDIVLLVRKEDAKVDALVSELDIHKVLPKESIAAVNRHHVFPAQPIISSSAS